MRIIYASQFERRYKKLSEEIQEEAERRAVLFEYDPFHPVLQTHKLQGKFQGLWAFSISFRYRIIFEFLGNGEVVFHTIGDHDIYR